MTFTNFQQDRFNYPNGPMPPGYILKFFSFRTLQVGNVGIRPSSTRHLDKDWEKEVKEYIKKHRIEEIIEPILTSLVIGAPITLSPKEHIKSKLERIKRNGIDATTWKAFIPKETIPEKFRIPVKYYDLIERIDNFGPCDEEYYRAAFNFRYLTLKRMAMELWQTYVKRKKLERKIEKEKTEKAITHYNGRKLKISLKNWRGQTIEQKRRRKNAEIKIAKIWCMKLAKVYISGWRNFTIKQLDTRKYFEKLERGEIHEDQFNKLLGNKDADVLYNLPRKIAIKIFSYLNIEQLSKCREVSREWSIIVQSPSLWGGIDYSECKHAIDDIGAGYHACISKLYLTRLNLSKTMGLYSRLTNTSLRNFAQCKNIQYLNFSQNNFSQPDESVKIMIAELPNLLMIDLSYTTISDATLRNIGIHCTNLQQLKLKQCTNFSTKGLYYLGVGKGCRLLRHLDISGCLQISTVGFEMFAKGSRNMVGYILNDLYSLEDSAFRQLVDRTGSIKTISLLSCSSISNAGLDSIRNCTKLESFKISSNMKIDDNIGSVAFRSCPQLRELSIIDCNKIGDRTLRALGFLHNLKILDFSRCQGVTDVGIRFLIECPSGSKLESITLQEISQLTDITLLRISQRCHNLKYLDVSYCENLTDSGFEFLSVLKASLSTVICRGTFISNRGASMLGGIKNMQVLNFSECQRIVDWEKVTRKINQEIDEIDLSVIKSVTNNGIKELAFNCRQLSSINISGCIELNDLSIQYISGVCRHLKHINVSGLPYISKRSIRFLKKGCKKLKSLIMKYMKAITVEDYELAKKYFEIVEYNQDDPPAWWQVAFNKADKYFDILNQIPTKKSPNEKNTMIIPSGHRDSIKIRTKYDIASDIRSQGIFIRPRTAIGVNEELKKKKEKFQRRRSSSYSHSFDGVTVNIINKLDPRNTHDDLFGTKRHIPIRRPTSAKMPSRKAIQPTRLQRPSSAGFMI